jgi:two-component system cell cycle sensor histidine kinase/response regulator CckA
MRAGPSIRTRDREALRATLVYLVAATLWVVLASLVRGLSSDHARLLHIDLPVEFGLVAVTGAVLFAWLRRETRGWREESEQRQALIERAPDMVYRLRIHPDLAFEYVSPASAAVAGYGPEEYYADAAAMLDTVHPDDRDRLHRLLKHPEEAGETLEFRWIHKNGQTIWTENHVSPVRDEEGRTIAIHGIARDVSHRRTSEERNRLLATAVDAAGEAVIITDPEGRIQYINPAFTDITGYGEDEAVGRTPGILKSGRHDQAFYEELWSTITSGRTFRGEMVNRRRDGRLYDQECTITPVLDHDGRVTHFVAVARDVTVEREMGDQVRFAQKMEAVGQVAAGIAHDFRNLLNVIEINAGRLPEDLSLPREPSEAEGGLSSPVKDIRGAAERGAELVGKLLTLGRQDHISLVPLDPGVTTRGMLSTLRTVLPEGITLTSRIADDLPLVLADRGSLEQILLNLVTNARDALGTEGEIAVEVDRVRRAPEAHEREGDQLLPGEFVRITVRDNGSGMTPDILRRVFEPYYTTKPEGRGTGLGLATIRSLMERHSGLVTVQSQPGRGTEFELYFPAEAVAAMEPIEVRRTMKPLPKGSETVLLVEDEEALRHVGARILGRLGYLVITASDGAEGLEVLSDPNAGIDLVVTDLVMPRMGGRALFEKSRANGWNVPFLFVSGYAPEEWGWRPNPDRRWLVLEKPWTMESLARQVREVLDRDSRAERAPDYRNAGGC